MTRLQRIITAGWAALLLAGGASHGAENLVANGGFEEGLDGWEVSLRGPGAKGVEAGKVVRLSSEARSGGKALLIDTTVLNPSGRITDKLRTRRPSYDIYVTRKVSGLKPNAWYLARFQARSPSAAVDAGFEFLADLKPWTIRSRKGGTRWKNIPFWVGRVFVPAAPMVGPDYRRHVLLKQTYPDNDAIVVGVRIRAPWTGKVLIDDVELIAVDPDRDLTRMETFLALRGAEPFKTVRKLNRRTTLVRAGAPAGAILVPDDRTHRALAAKIHDRVRQLTGAALPVVTNLSDVPAGANIVALGSANTSDLVARLHFNRYVTVDALSPGPGGYVIWTVTEPYGLALKQNAIVVGGSDATGQAAAVDAFCRLLAADGKGITVDFLHTVFPARKLPPDARKVPTRSSGARSYGYRTPFAGFSKWFLAKWLATGDIEIARMARAEILNVLDDTLSKPYRISEWDTHEVGLAWDSLEELGVFSDADRLKITNLMLGYLHERPRTASDWGTSRFMKGAPLWNHQTKGLAAAYTMARHFQRFYPQADARFAYYLAAPHNAFRQAAGISKPQENSGNYWQITMKFAIAYYLGEWDKTFFDSGALRRYAEYTAHVHDNKGGLAGFGDTYYAYHGPGPFDIQKNWFGPPLAFWVYRDPKILWWLDRVRPGWKNPYHRDVKPVEWSELAGVTKVPLEPSLYSPSGKRVPFWGSGGQHSDMPVGDVTRAETFDKIVMRESLAPDGQYLVIDGNGRGIHSGRGTNQIAKLTIGGEDLLIGSTYKANNVRTNCAVVVCKDVKIDDPQAKGKAPYPFVWWAPLARGVPAYAALDGLADLPSAGFTQTSCRNHMNVADWRRSILWAKGDFFVMIDQVTAGEAGTYHVESNYATCPENRKGAYPRLTKRTWKVLDDKRTFEVAYRRDDGLKHYIATDGAADLVLDPYRYRCEYVHKDIVRQQLVDRKLAAGETVALMTLFYGDKGGDRKGYRIERIGPAEGVVLAGDRPVAWFGLGRSTAAGPIRARAFLLTGGKLALMDATQAGTHLRSDRPISRQIELPAAEARRILNAASKRIAR